VLDHDEGQALVWVESWDHLREQGRLNGPPRVMVEIKRNGDLANLDPSQALDFAMMLVRQVVRAPGAPKTWRDLRVKRVAEQVERIRDRLAKGYRR